MTPSRLIRGGKLPAPQPEQPIPHLLERRRPGHPHPEAYDGRALYFEFRLWLCHIRDKRQHDSHYRTDHDRKRHCRFAQVGQMTYR